MLLLGAVVQLPRDFIGISVFDFNNHHPSSDGPTYWEGVGTPNNFDYPKFMFHSISITDNFDYPKFMFHSISITS